MLDLLAHNEIISHIKSYSKIFIPNSRQDWIQVFCPYCDDSHRKSGLISHGHMYLSRYSNFCHCFRCDTNTSIKKFMIDIGFNNLQLLNQVIPKSYNHTFFSSNCIKSNQTHISQLKNIEIMHNEFREKYPEKYQQFLKYIFSRLGSIDLYQFFIEPILYNNDQLGINFKNYFQYPSVIRLIDNKNQRYIKPQNSQLYFFQNPSEQLTKQNQIVLTEGQFDLLTLYLYNENFNRNCFYVAINGKSYLSSLIKLISNYCMIGKYTVNIIFDGDINNPLYLLKQYHSKLTNLNPKIKLVGYHPIYSNDVNGFNFIQRVS